MPTKKLNKLMTLLTMDFPERLSTLRREKRMTQQQLADATEIHVSQIKRYEAGSSQPTIDVLKKLALALSVSADLLLFDKDERGPTGDLRLQFEAVERLSEDDQRTIASLIDAYLKKSQIESIMQAR
jgi:transcriptional regulator with XRE-family HTH domain